MVPNEPTERTFSHAWALLVAMGLVPEHCRITVQYMTGSVRMMRLRLTTVVVENL